MNQVVPASGPVRIRLREKGQFWTPSWVADPMVRYVLAAGAQTLFDPAVGPGTFFVTARAQGFKGAFSGCELHNEALEESRLHGLNSADLADIWTGDFLSLPFRRVPGIVSNPPYIRHHRIPASAKAYVQKQVRNDLGLAIDGRAGLHVYFFIRCLQMLEKKGRLAFIVSADICEGVFAKTLWTWVTDHFCLDGVITFSPDAAPFPGIDTNAVIFLIRNEEPRDRFVWARVLKPDADSLTRLFMDLDAAQGTDSIEVNKRDISEGIATGLSRPAYKPNGNILPLKDIADVMRGIATGANDYFVMTTAQMRERKLDKSFFVRCVGRTRDCPSDRITEARLAELDEAGRPTWLLNLPDMPLDQLSNPVRRYLQIGKEQGLPDKALIKSRRTWYRMEQRKAPPLLFAYLGRRSSRFILNEAGIVPLTGFLCVYPKPDVNIYALWRVLNDAAVIEGLSRVGKSYGDGAIKVEPRSLEQLTIPCSILENLGIRVDASTSQLPLLELRQKYQVKAVRSRGSR
mgnify:CR=1 FL=1